MSGEEQNYSLYIHLPFCKHKCPYCHFYVIPENDTHKKKLLKYLKVEWDLVKDATLNKTLRSVYFGGGTPSLLSPEEISEITSLFPISKDTEVTLECNPEGVTFSKLKGFKKAGINRLSIGIQTFSNSLLQELEREHSAEEGKKIVTLSNDAGFENITIDLMYDLPSQNFSHWKESLEIATSLPITHLSLYNLVIEPHTSFYKHKEMISAKQPADKASTEMYQYAQEHFKAKGWEQYEISAFCKKGYRSIHNTGYWLGRPFLGLGPSSHSYWQGQRHSNWGRINRYFKELEQGSLPIEEQESLTKEARSRELFCVEIRMLEGILHTKLKKHYSHLSKEISTLKKEGFLKENNTHLSLTQKGVLFYDTVATQCI